MTYTLPEGTFQLMKVNVKPAHAPFLPKKKHMNSVSNCFPADPGPTSLNK